MESDKNFHNFPAQSTYVQGGSGAASEPQIPTPLHTIDSKKMKYMFGKSKNPQEIRNRYQDSTTWSFYQTGKALLDKRLQNPNHKTTDEELAEYLSKAT